MNGVSEMRRLRLRHHTNSSVLATSRTAADAAPAGTIVIGMLGVKIQPMGDAAAHHLSGKYNGEMRQGGQLCALPETCSALLRRAESHLLSCTTRQGKRCKEATRVPLVTHGGMSHLQLCQQCEAQNLTPPGQGTACTGNIRAAQELLCSCATSFKGCQTRDYEQCLYYDCTVNVVQDGP